MTDGVLELMLVKKTGRLSFLRLIGKYKNGTLVDKDTCRVTLPKYKDLVTYLKVKSVRISGIKQYCADGEIIADTKVDVCVMPDALNYLT